MGFTIREPGSAITHFAGMLLATAASVPLLVKAGLDSVRCLVAMGIFMASMILLYGASTVYHTVIASDKILKIFRKADHMMIFVLIAGTYTPVCLVVLSPNKGIPMLALIWGITIVGICINALWINCPKWFSSALYIAMGWLVVSVFSQLLVNLSNAAFGWLLAGGIIYTIGGVIYALKLPIFNARHKMFGSHEIFHLFVIGGSICHFVLMYQYVAVM